MDLARERRYSQIAEAYPEEYRLRQQDKLGHRWPRGESYLDVISRLEPLIHELENFREPVLLVGHQAVLRIIYAYFTARPRQEAPKLSFPLNTVVRLIPRTHECGEEHFHIGSGQEDAVEPPSH